MCRGWSFIDSWADDWSLKKRGGSWCAGAGHSLIFVARSITSDPATIEWAGVDLDIEMKKEGILDTFEHVWMFKGMDNDFFFKPGNSPESSLIN